MSILSALKYGQQLENVETWKHAQMVLVMIIGLLPIVFPDIDMSILIKIDSALSVIITYLTAATSSKIGV